MSCEVAALPFQAYANYETWSIDFGSTCQHFYIISIFKNYVANCYFFALFLVKILNFRGFLSEARKLLTEFAKLLADLTKMLAGKYNMLN